MDQLPSTESPVLGFRRLSNQPDAETLEVFFHSPATPQELINLFQEKLRSIPPIPSSNLSGRGSFSGKLFNKSSIHSLENQQSDFDSFTLECSPSPHSDLPETEKTGEIKTSGTAHG